MSDRPLPSICSLIIWVMYCLLWFIPLSSQGQMGCTDPLASNYDPTATINDGSCTYPPTSYTPAWVATLPTSLSELSGLSWHNGWLWGINDSGNEPRIWAIDTTDGQTLGYATIAGVSLIDWEALAKSDTHLFIGDIGNNDGLRSSLRILRIALDQLDTGVVLTPDIIQYHYEDWDPNLPASQKKDFDCEAMIFSGDSLHLFTKGWNSFQTKHYVVPATPGDHTAKYLQSFDCQGQITGGARTPEGAWVLLGYNVQTAQSFLYLLYDTPMLPPPPTDPFSKNKRRIGLGSALTNGQTESLTFVSPALGYMGSEAFAILPAQLLRLGIGQWLYPPTTATSSAMNIPALHLRSEGTTDRYTFEWTGNEPLQLLITHSSGEVVWKKQLPANSIWMWDASFLPTGVYFYSAHTAQTRKNYTGKLLVIH